MKLNTTKKRTRAQKAKSPNAFSGVIDLNSLDDVNCSRSDAGEEKDKMKQKKNEMRKNYVVTGVQTS